MRSNQGFTLIEMLVSVTILIVVVGGGLAGYIQFNDRQSLVTAGNRVESLMRTAQKRARVGDTPAGCDRLISYNMVFSAASPDVQMQAECNNTTITVMTESLPGSVIAATSNTIKFNVLAGGVDNPGLVLLQGSDGSQVIEVSSGGGIVSYSYDDLPSEPEGGPEEVQNPEGPGDGVDPGGPGQQEEFF